MNIGILGAGNIGGSLARAWAAAGHAVRLGVRDPSRPEIQPLLAGGQGRVSAGSPGEAASFGDVLVLAVPGGAVAELVDDLADKLSGKTVIDTTNNVRGPGPLSAVAQVAERAPAAHLFRAFNSVGWENIRQPRYGRLLADMVYCGPEGAGREAVAQLIADTGFRPIYAGDLGQLEVVDNLTRLWFALVRGQGYGRRVAFKVLTEADEKA
jgi:predicted dinucleotide-binding enzyme